MPGPPTLPRPTAVPRIARAVDRLGEGLIGPLRGIDSADRIFYTASALADHGLLWHAVSATRATAGAAGRREAARLSLSLGAESVLVNGAIKSMFRRTRPITDLPRPFHLRTPRTSSFPSGHASAAFLAATLLSDGRPRQAPAWFGLAAVVAASRVHVRIHHPSDVVVGAAVGIAMGLAVRRLVPLDRIGAAHQPTAPN